MKDYTKLSRGLQQSIDILSNVKDELSFRYNEISILREIDSYILSSNEAHSNPHSSEITRLFRRVIKALNRLLPDEASCAFYVNFDTRFELVSGADPALFPNTIHCNATSLDWKIVEHHPIHRRSEGSPFSKAFREADVVYTEPLFIFETVLLGVFIVQANDRPERPVVNWLDSKEHIDSLRGIFRQLKIAYKHLVEHGRAAALNNLWSEFADKDFSPSYCLHLLALRLSEMTPILGPMRFRNKPGVQILFRHEDSLRILATTGSERDTEFVSISDSISGLALRNLQTVNVDPSAPEYNTLYKNFLGRSRQIRSELAIPMLLTDHAIGVVNFESIDEFAFSSVQARTIEEIVRKITPVAVSLKARLDHNREAQSAYSAIMTRYLHAFSAVLRHEVSSPTSALSSNIDNIRRRLTSHNFLPDDVINELDNAEANYRRIDTSMFGFINDLSNYGIIGPIRILDLLKETVEMINDTDRPSIGSNSLETIGGLEERHEYKIDLLGRKNYRVNASRLLKPYLVCLLDNSVRSIRNKRSSGGLPQGGKISIQVREDADDSRSILITIRDNGQGVSREQLEILRRFRIGTRFRNDQGQGYGLAATQRYLAEVGGWIELDSIENRFFSVTISLKHEM